MGEEETGFSQKWDFRRKENSSVDFLDDDDQESNSSHEPVLKRHKLVSQLDKRTTTTTGANRKQQQLGKTRRSSSRKGRAKPEKAKKTSQSTRKSTRAEEGDCVKKSKRVSRKCKPDDDSVKGIGVFMETLLDDLKASRESLFGWMSAEICKLDGDNVSVTVSPKKETRTRKEGKKKAQVQRPKRTIRSKKVPEGEKEKKGQAQGENQKEKQSNSEEKIAEKNIVEVETENVRGQSQEQCNAGFDCNVRPLERYLRCDKATDSRTNYYFQPQRQHQEHHGNNGQFMKLIIPNDEEKAKNLGSTSIEKQKSLVLGICAQKCGLETSEKPSRGKKTTAEANLGPTRDATKVKSMVLSAESQKDRNFETPVEPKLSSSLLMPVASSLCSPSFLSNPGIASFPSNNFQLRPLPLSLIQHSTENQAGSSFAHQGSRNLNSLYPSSAYFQRFISPGFNFPIQVSSDNSLRDNSGNFLGGLRMSEGAMRFSGGVLPEQFSGVDFNNNFSNYRTNSGRQMQFQTHNITDGNGSLFQN